MKTLLFTNWSLMRAIRLGFSIFLIVQAFVLQEWLFLLFAGFFLFQAIFNLGCGLSGCDIPKSNNTTNEH